MRAISRIITVPVDGKPMDFRLTKLDAFSGVFLLRLLAKRLRQQRPQKKTEAACRGLRLPVTSGIPVYHYLMPGCTDIMVRNIGKYF